MPIYEYRCHECGHELEKLQRMSDAPLTDCPECGKAGLKRLISAAGFRLKGAGWYETDFKKGNQRNLAEGAKGKEAGFSEATSNGSSTESKKESAGDKGAPAAKAPADSAGSKSASSTAGTS